MYSAAAAAAFDVLVILICYGIRHIFNNDDIHMSFAHMICTFSTIVASFT